MTKEQAKNEKETLIGAMELIKGYCMGNSNCRKCIFCNKCGKCILQTAPINWGG